MEELSRSEFLRLTTDKQDEYLKSLLGDSDAESEIPSDSDDEDWIPVRNRGEMENSPCDNIADPENPEIQSQLVEETNGEEEYVAAATEEILSSYISKDKTQWRKRPLPRQQTPAGNIVRQRAGPRRDTESLSISDTFKKIFTLDIVDIIIRNTNKNAKRYCEEYKAQNPDKPDVAWKALTVQELYAFIGVLICAGANNSNTDRSSDMWKSSSVPLYRAAMGVRRFLNILRFVRFDDPDARREDVLGPIRDVWTRFTGNLSRNYRPTECLAVDAQLCPFRGHASFAQYLPSKPAKYGIRIWWICDAESCYPLAGILDAGKSGKTRGKNQAERVVKELVAPYKTSGRNVCVDKSLASLSLAKHLLSWDLTVVAAVKKTKPYVPKALAASRAREVHSTLFGFHENVTMCSYVPKRNKAIILLSTMHSDAEIANDAKKKQPEMMLRYNKYKVAVDSMDQAIRRFTTQRRTKDWPLALFYNMLDIAGFAAYTIYHENNKMLSRRSNERRAFMRQLGQELASPAIEERAESTHVMRNYMTKIAIESIIGREMANRANHVVVGEEPARDNSGRKRVVGSCHMCYKETIKKRRKTRKSCGTCEKPVCDEHAITVNKCKECVSFGFS